MPAGCLWVWADRDHKPLLAVLFHALCKLSLKLTVVFAVLQPYPTPTSPTKCCQELLNLCSPQHWARVISLSVWVDLEVSPKCSSHLAAGCPTWSLGSCSDDVWTQRWPKIKNGRRLTPLSTEVLMPRNILSSRCLFLWWFSWDWKSSSAAEDAKKKIPADLSTESHLFEALLRL